MDGGFYCLNIPILFLNNFVLKEKKMKEIHRIVVLPADVIQRIAQLTYFNAKGEAYILGAKSLGLDKLAERFAALEARRVEKGYLDNEVETDRRTAYEEMMKYAKMNMSEADYDLFYMAF